MNFQYGNRLYIININFQFLLILFKFKIFLKYESNDIYRNVIKKKYKYIDEKKKKTIKAKRKIANKKPSRLKSQRDCDALEAIYNAHKHRLYCHMSLNHKRNATQYHYALKNNKKLLYSMH